MFEVCLASGRCLIRKESAFADSGRFPKPSYGEEEGQPSCSKLNMRLISRALLNSLPRAKPIIPHHRLAPASASARFYASSPFQPSPTPQLPNPLQPDQKPNNGDESSSYSSEHASIKEKMTSRLPAFGSNPAIDALLATTVGIILVFGGGM
jgi:hypothetical protein